MVGDSYILYYRTSHGKQDMLLLVPFVVTVVIGGVLFWFSVPWCCYSIGHSGRIVIWTVAIMIWQGITVSLITMAMPVILMTVGIASSIHILTKYKEALKAGLPSGRRLWKRFELHLREVASRPHHIGGFASLIRPSCTHARVWRIDCSGVFLAMVLSLSFVPALLILVKEPEVGRERRPLGPDGFLTRILNTLSSW